MALEYITQSDFSGGINHTDDQSFIGDNEVLDAEDCFVDYRGLVKRRGPIVFNGVTISNRDPFSTGIDWGAPKVIAAGRHDYGANQGLFVLTRQAIGQAANMVLWFIPYDGPNPGTPKELIRGACSTTRAGVASICPAITKATSESATANAKYNRTLISCEAFTVVVLVRKGSAFPENDNNNQLNYPESSYTKNLTTTISGTTWAFRISMVAKKTWANQTITVGGDVINPRLEDRDFRMAATVGGYTFLAGDSEMVQHFYWSASEDSTQWSPDDFEYAPDLTSSPVKALVNMGESLCILKERSIFMLRVGNSGPDGWSLSQRSADIGTCDQRSVAHWKDSIIFADQRGIYMFDGYEVQNISENISGLWRPVFNSRNAEAWSDSKTYVTGDSVYFNNGTSTLLYTAIDYSTGVAPTSDSTKWRLAYQTYNSNWSVVGFVFNEYYVVAVTDPRGTSKIGFICHLPTRAWTRLTGAIVTAASAIPDDSSKVVGFSFPVAIPGVAAEGAQLIQLSTMLDGCIGKDFLNDGPNMSITTARIAGGDRFRSKVWRRVEVSQYSEGSTGDLQVEICTGTDAANNTYSSLGTLPKNADTKTRFRIGKRSRALSVRIREVSSGGGLLSNAIISGIRIGLKQMRPSRDEGN